MADVRRPDGDMAASSGSDGPDEDLEVPGGVSAYTRERLLEVGRVVDIPDGWSPIHGGEPADQAYLVLEGRLRILRAGREVALLGRGSFVGEMGLVDHRLRNARVVATGPVRTLAWPRADFQQLRAELPDLEALLQQVTSQRHRENEDG
ncbi:Crp/Fnr family transcriptional regulator [Nocardioides aurantiacus]|uniref:Crp/Fnr family transcriptional regulator n=1 Tax=Nocardioides aurantiacus TaxID=86796 RepID=UPI00403F72CB